MSEFTKLLGELKAETEALTKALPSGESNAEDKTVAAAAADGAATSAAAAKPGEKPGAEGDENPPSATADGDDDDLTMGKSMQAIIDGKTVDVVDGTEMVKALNSKVLAAQADLVAVMPVLQAQANLLKAQNATIATLTGRVGDMQKALNEYANGGAGRRTALTSAAPAADGGAAAAASSGGVDMTKALGGLSGKDFLAKSLDAMKAGKISGDQLRMAETTLNHGQPMNPEFVKLVLGAK